MSTHVPEHPTDWEAQRDRLSALLDGQLGAAEAAALREHVAECARCTEELAALRRVVGALGALPQPKAPRSFALPLTTALPDDAPAPLSLAAARARRSRWVAVTQWAGAAAACIGFVLLVGTFALGGRSAASTMASFGIARHSPSGAEITNTAQVPAATTTPKGVQDAIASATARAASGSAPVASPTPAPTAATRQHASPSFEPPDPKAVARTTGATLLFGGLAALLVGWGVRRRAAPH
jgi:anti-sigma factor RsiW